MPPEQPQPPRNTDRTVHYTMKTSSRPASTPGQGNTPAFRSAKSSTTPTAQSPYFPYSVGQPYPPKLSPSNTAANRLTTPQVSHDTSQARTPSPNYFALVVEPTPDPRDTSMLPRENWSPATSSVKSFAAAIPKQLPLDANPEFEAFRRQADANRGASGFNLATSHFGVGGAWQSKIDTDHDISSSGPRRPRVPRWHTHGSNMSIGSVSAMRAPGTTVAPSVAALDQQGRQPPQPSRPSLPSKASSVGGYQPSATRMDLDMDASNLHDSAYVSEDSKRNSEDVPINPPSPRQTSFFESPVPFESNTDHRTSLSTNEDRHPRLSVPQGKLDPPTPAPQSRPVRAGTLPNPAADSFSPAMIHPSELKDIIQDSSADDLLLLDLRVATLYQASRIEGALNLCIPTTLLKRATFDLQKLRQTFQTDEHQDKFACWQETKFLVVYDAHSADTRDATSCINMLKKFTAAGYNGKACILRGGFKAFAAAYPQLIDRRHGGERAGKPSLTLKSGNDGERPSVAPVIGGVMLPTGTDAVPNPFFSNIRQNMDLADGVGQMDISVPASLNNKGLPTWLSQVAEKADHGKQVSERFLTIEKKEQARMRKAYTAYKSNTSSLTPGSSTVEISGIEKGDKNRYNNIFPFEHSRVRLDGRQQGESDYINASHIKATRSHKKYIASQGPLPATFEDFWSMIWDQDVRVIVMLTAEHEGGHLKCHPYWREREFGPLKLRSLGEKKVSLDIDKPQSTSDNSSQTPKNQNASTPGPQSTQKQAVAEGRRRANTTTTNPLKPDNEGFFKAQAQSPQEVPIVVVRKFALSHGAHPFAPIREITHLHYSSWPDFGAPAQPSHLLALVELANSMQLAAYPVDVNSAIASSERAGSRLSSQNSGSRDFGGSSASKFGKNNSWPDEPLTDPDARPMLVHCSAGCGRTGTFCTVDSVVDMLKRQRQRAARRLSAAAAAREKRVRREGIKRKLEQRDMDGDVSMAGIAAEEKDRSLRRDSVSVSPTRASFTDSPLFSSPPKFPFPSIAETRELGGSSFSGSDEGTGYSCSSSSDEQQQQPSPTKGASEVGSMIGLDTAWMDDDSIDLIAATVEEFRGQRLSMVQTIRQFVLCYETVLEWVARLQQRTHTEGEGGLPLFSAASVPGRVARSRMRSGSVQGEAKQAA
ncbi:hypothetical protein MCOR30_003093 [Pyricularia oryzae]|nr:hypothetical protein MCOR30_003093 [Pyricularia oryzae]